MAKKFMCGCSATKIGSRRAMKCPIKGKRQVGRKGYMYKFLGAGDKAGNCTYMPILKRGKRGKPCSKKVRKAVRRHCGKRI